jgi:hypothetical protein
MLLTSRVVGHKGSVGWVAFTKLNMVVCGSWVVLRVLCCSSFGRKVSTSLLLSTSEPRTRSYILRISNDLHPHLSTNIIGRRE